MPGIFGLITKMPSEHASSELTSMLKTSSHQSFYHCGTWVDERLGVYIGWTAHPGSFGDGMPIRNELADLALIFSGEDYPEPGIDSHLRERGHTVAEGGASYLVHLSEEDPAFPAALNGRFHGLLADLSQGKVTLFNDRYGMHRLYYHESKDAFYFAAEAKAILAVCPHLRKANTRSLGEFVAYSCVLENRTLFDGVFVLPGASAWVFHDGTIQRRSQYFRPQEWENQLPLEGESYYRALKEVFSRNLPRYLCAQERIGMSLTGGLDTRAVMAWQRLPPGSLPCYTYGGSIRECEDVVVARKVARECHQPHQVIEVGDEFLSNFSHYAERSIYLSDACIDLLRSPDLYLSEKARQIAPVRMTGLYGDEILRCLPAFKPTQLQPGLFCPTLVDFVQQAQTTYTALLKGHPLSFSAFQQAPWHHYGILCLEQTQVTARTPFLDNDLIRTVYRSPKSAFANNDLRLRLINDGNPRLARIRTDRGVGGPEGLSGLVSRFFQQFTFKAEYACDYGMPQWLARIDRFSPVHFDRVFLGRHKVFHFRLWYRNALGNYVREMLLDPKTLSRPYLNRAAVEAVVQGHVKGNRNFTLEIHKLLTLELMQRLFFDAL